MKAKFNLKCLIGFYITLLILALSACNSPDTPADVSKKFWSAVQERDMESAKIVSTWDTVDYLKYLNAEKFHPERFEVGEEMIGETRAEVQTVLFTSKAGTSGIKLPGVTILVMTENGWRVNVKQSMASVIKYSTNTVFDQLNGLMQEGIKKFDKSFSGVINELDQALEKSAEELKRELSKPLNQLEIQPNQDLQNKSLKKPIDETFKKQI